MSELVSDGCRHTLGELAQRSGAILSGDPQLSVTGMATLQAAQPGQLSFLSNPKYQKHLQTTRAGAVIVAPDMVAHCPCATLSHPDPYLVYARLSQLWSVDPAHSMEPRRHPSASIDASAILGEGVVIEAGAVIQAGARIGANAVIGAGTVVGVGSVIGDNSRLFAHVSVYHGVEIGRHCIIHAGVVIGSDGFGFAPHQGTWVKIAQLGGVRIGDEVEIGANSTIDRGALDPTIIGNGVKLDNQVQIAHNVIIGDHTVMAACCAVAGSTTIGRHCVFAGKVGIAGHLNIVDHCHVTAMSMVIRNLNEAGVYSSGTGIQPNAEWRKSIARLRRLDQFAGRLNEIERLIKKKDDEPGA
jgi:UDP-3-O-[3-hydroxymyristoyl] glucosamine N-acyltransferase